MTPTSEEQHRYVWLSALADLTSPTHKFPDKDLRLFARLLGTLPREVFCEASMREVSLDLDRFPGVKDLYERLENWWERHRQKPLRIAGPDKAQPRWERRPHEGSNSYLRRRLLEAAGAAVPHELMPDDYPAADLRYEWDDPDGILRLVHRIQTEAAAAFRRPLLVMLGAVVQQHAPQHFGFLPPEIVALASAGAHIVGEPA